MKRLILTLLTVFTVVFAEAQIQWTLPQGLGGSNTLVTANGGLRVPKGIIIGNFADSLSVNATQADFYEGLYVDIAGILHRRTNNKWLRIGSDKQNLITVTTNFTTGPATWNQLTGALNIPNYASGAGTVLGTPSNPYINAHFVDPSGQQWIMRVDINGAIVTQKYPIIVTTYTEAITWKTLYFATITPAGSGGFTTDAISTSFETVKEFTGSGNLTYKYSTPTPTAAGTDIGFGINVGTQYINMAYVYEAGVSKFKFTTNTSYGSLAEITGATVDISKFYRWIRTGNLISIYSDVSENGTFSTLIRSFPEAYTASNVYGSGYINKAGDGILSGKYISNNLITVR